MGVSERPRKTSPEYSLHQKYLAQVIETVGALTLANINPQSAASGEPLEEIYVDLPTEYALLAEVKDADIVDWWVSTDRSQRSRTRYDMLPEGNAPVERRTRPQELGWQDDTGLKARIAQAQSDYHAQRANATRARENEELYHRDIEDGAHMVTPSLSVTQIAAACRRLVALGAPGSGKSTFVRHLALCLAGEALEHRTRDADLTCLPGWTHGVLTPVYIELRRFVGSPHFPPGLGDDHRWTEHLLRYIQAEILGETLAAYAPYLEQALREGHALLILDGLDEVPYPPGKGNLALRQKQLQALAASLNIHYGASRIVVASRPYAYENWQLASYTTVRIFPFEDAHRIALATNLFRLSHYAEPEQKAERLNAALQQQGVSAELADNPLFVTLMATIFARSERGESLPSRKGALYRESVLLLLERWTKGKQGTPTLADLLGKCHRDELLARLAKLAYKVHSDYGADNRGVTPEVPAGLLFTELFQMQRDDPSVDAQGLMSYLSETAGLLISPGHRQDDPVFHFAHRTFQEYLAAVHLVNVFCGADFVPVRDHISRQPGLWRIPCLLAGDVLRDTQSERDAFARLWMLVSDLLDGDSPKTALTSGDMHWWPLWLAAGIVQEQELVDPVRQSRFDLATRQALVTWLVKLLETPGALPPPERAHCGRVLGLLGDTRPGVGVREDGLPDIVWGLPVPVGAYPVGGDDEAWNSLPGSNFSLTYSYCLSQYPVTNAQFQCFVDADAAGYNNRDYWTAEGWRWKGDRRVPWEREGSSGLNNHPRVSVSWYEALAFCRWLTVRYREQGLLGPGETINLPKELEWEIGCRGTEGLVYPYGNEYDLSKGNTDGAEIGQTSAVGLFPDGSSPFGVMDMSGNVWEWCLTSYEDGSNEVNGDASRVLRGGSWNYFADVARAATRFFNDPYYRNNDFGFRVVCLPH